MADFEKQSRCCTSAPPVDVCIDDEREGKDEKNGDDTESVEDPMLQVMEGDIVLLSHSGIKKHHAAFVVVVDDEICICHATPNPKQLNDIVLTRPFGGVTITSIDDEFASDMYDSVEVHRIYKISYEAYVMANCKEYIATTHGATFPERSTFRRKYVQHDFCDQFVIEMLRFSGALSMDDERKNDIETLLRSLQRECRSEMVQKMSMSQSTATPCGTLKHSHSLSNAEVIQIRDGTYDIFLSV